MGLKSRKSTKSPPILSHEFMIQNHADIVSCVAMVFVCALMFQTTAPYASLFMAIHHNVTSAESIAARIPPVYTYGAKDLCVTFFYFLICIVMQAILQEYVLDKINRKMHLSKMKHSRFNESGQLLVFYLVSVLWGGDIIFRENYILNVGRLWEGYPHHEMTFMFKFFFIVQISYWLHCFPELYFQKTKKEEMGPRITYASLYLIFLSSAYLLNFTRVALCLILIHYIVECVFHVARLLYYAEKAQAAQIAFKVYDIAFVLIRLGSITLSVLTFWYGLALTDTATLHFAEGNFNTQTIRINCLLSVCLVQAWLMWNYINFHLKRFRERTLARKKSTKKEKKSKKDEAKRNSEEDVSELPEVDQNTKKDQIRSRAAASRGKK